MELKSVSHSRVDRPNPRPRPSRCSRPRPVAVACGGAERRAQPAGVPAMPVEVATLVARPVEQTTEFVGIVQSRRSTTVQPQVEGFITRILVRSGDRVAPGATLMEIDVRMQQAAVASLESQRAARRADVDYARQQATRMKTLLEGGAASQAELEQAQTALATSEAQLQAIEAQIREQTRDPRLPPRQRARRRRRRRRARARRRQRDQVHRAHHDRPERGPRGVHQRPRPGGGEAEGGPARPHRRRARAAPGRRDAVVRVPFGRPRDPVGPGQGRPRSRPAASAPSSSSARRSCGRRRPR